MDLAVVGSINGKRRQGDVVAGARLQASHNLVEVASGKWVFRRRRRR